MSGYLNKEEIKQWRSSLEKITLEEFAQRLGKALKEEKQTKDIVDMVLKNESTTSKLSDDSNDIGSKKKKVLEAAQAAVDAQGEVVKKAPKSLDLSSLNLTFKKPLTERERVVLNIFLENQDKIVYAKELAETLRLPTDYVYKYIKNLRTKISQDILQNADKGGYKICIIK